MPKILINGVFDLLHTGHFNLLMQARDIATGSGRVIVCLDEDEKCMADKGLQRPIFSVLERAKSLLDLKFGNYNIVDQVEFFYTNKQLENIIRREKPDYLLKGSDWRDKPVVGSQYSKVLFYERENYSTTDIVRRVLEKHTILK
jgi:cytidyltransferase-like protein